MTLVAENEQHRHQIEAGVKGRIKGHKFEEEVSIEINNIIRPDYNISIVSPNIFEGNPAEILLEYISKDKGVKIQRAKAYWLGGLATAGAGAEIENDEGKVISGSKSDVVIDVIYENGCKDTIGVSVKSCKSNAQVCLTTCGKFCALLRENNIPVSETAEIGLKMFCGENGYSPQDGYLPEDTSNIPSNRTARPERWYWEELPFDVQLEWEKIFSEHQDEITILILQKATAYKTDKFKPDYILHECKEHEDIDNCTVAVMSIIEFAEYSRLFDTFGLKGKKVQKGKYKGIDLAEHQYPHFGYIQFQPIGNKQNFSELQFNLKSNYYKTFEKLKTEFKLPLGFQFGNSEIM